MKSLETRFKFYGHKWGNWETIPVSTLIIVPPDRNGYLICSCEHVDGVIASVKETCRYHSDQSDYLAELAQASRDKTRNLRLLGPEGYAANERLLNKAA